MTALSQPVAPPALLTYEQYLAEGEISQRYDILDGERILMTSPVRRHQNVAYNIAESLKQFSRTTGRGSMVMALCDVLITRIPLRVRQPDVLFISRERLAQNPSEDVPAPLSPPPELVVEVLSPSDTDYVLEAKLADYASVGVQECWTVDLIGETVAVLRVTPNGSRAEANYGRGETVVSLTFPELTVPVEAIFAA